MKIGFELEVYDKESKRYLDDDEYVIYRGELWLWDKYDSEMSPYYGDWLEVKLKMV